jgi:hypothetical protein
MTRHVQLVPPPGDPLGMRGLDPLWWGRYCGMPVPWRGRPRAPRPTYARRSRQAPRQRKAVVPENQP